MQDAPPRRPPPPPPPNRRRPSVSNNEQDVVDNGGTQGSSAEVNHNFENCAELEEKQAAQIPAANGPAAFRLELEKVLAGRGGLSTATDLGVSEVSEASPSPELPAEPAEIPTRAADKVAVPQRHKSSPTLTIERQNSGSPDIPKVPSTSSMVASNLATATTKINSSLGARSTAGSEGTCTEVSSVRSVLAASIDKVLNEASSPGARSQPLRSISAPQAAEASKISPTAYNPWRRKNLEGDLQDAISQLRESNERSARLTEELQQAQLEIRRLNSQLAVQRDQCDLLRGLNGSRSSSVQSSMGRSNQQRNLCQHICAALGRR